MRRGRGCRLAGQTLRRKPPALREADREPGDGDALERDALDVDALDVVHLEPDVDDGVGVVFRGFADERTDRRLVARPRFRAPPPPASAWSP